MKLALTLASASLLRTCLAVIDPIIIKVMQSTFQLPVLIQPGFQILLREQRYSIVSICSPQQTADHEINSASYIRGIAYQRLFPSPLCPTRFH